MKTSFMNILFTLTFFIGLLPFGHLYGQYKFSNDLILDFNTKGMPTGYTPRWDQVRDHDHLIDADARIPSFLEDFDRNITFGSAVNLSLGIYNGKAVIFWEADYMMIYYCVLNPKDIPIHITGNKQTFVLTNFQPFKDFSKIYNVENNKQWTPESDLKAQVSLSCDDKGNLSIDFILEKFKNGKLSLRQSTKETFKSENKLSIAKATILAANAKFKPMVEHYLTLKYNGWFYDYLYVPNSLTDIEIVAKDKIGNPAQIRGHCVFTMDGKQKGWIDLLLDNNQVYGVIFFDGKTRVHTPAMNEKKQLLSADQIKKMQILQHKYLFNKFKTIHKEYAPDIVNGKSCLQNVILDHTRTVDKGHVTFYDENGTLDYGEHLGYEIQGDKHEGMVNACNKELIVWGITMEVENNAIFYKDISFELKPNQRVFKENVLSNFSFNTLINNEYCYFFSHTPIDANNIVLGKKNDEIIAKIRVQSFKRIDQNKFEVASNVTSTDLILNKGDKISIKASGKITFGMFAGSGGPEGIEGYTSYNKDENFKHGALLGRIGSGEWFLIGENKTIIADRDGKLDLFVNDKASYDNLGSFIVEYSVTKSNNNSLKSIVPEKPIINSNSENRNIQTANQNFTNNNSSETTDNKQTISKEELSKIIAKVDQETLSKKFESQFEIVIKDLSNSAEIVKRKLEEAQSKLIKNKTEEKRLNDRYLEIKDRISEYWEINYFLMERKRIAEADSKLLFIDEFNCQIEINDKQKTDSGKLIIVESKRVPNRVYVILGSNFRTHNWTTDAWILEGKSQDGQIIAFHPSYDSRIQQLNWVRTIILEKRNKDYTGSFSVEKYFITGAWTNDGTSNQELEIINGNIYTMNQ